MMTTTIRPYPITIDNKRLSLNSFTNLSDQPMGQVLSWLPDQLKAEELVVFPDIGPASSARLPTGVAVRLSLKSDWHKYAVSDCGCGMQLLRSDLLEEEFLSNLSEWDKLGERLSKNKGKLGDLGGGNHFIDAISCQETKRIYFLIHTGSRDESKLVDDLIDRPKEFETKFLKVADWAKENRNTIALEISRRYTIAECVLDKSHNFYELTSEGDVIIRKGTVSFRPGERTVLPSSMTGDVVLLEGGQGASQFLNSLSHGTGRVTRRSETKRMMSVSEIADVRRSVYIPSYISDESIKGDAPQGYRPLDDCLQLLNVGEEGDKSDIGTIVQRFSVIAYLGHLPTL